MTIAQSRACGAGVSHPPTGRVPFSDERSGQPDSVSTNGMRFLPSLMGLGFVPYRDRALKRWAILRGEEAKHLLDLTGIVFLIAGRLSGHLLAGGEKESSAGSAL
jgi:hypothetical protein